MVKLMVFLKISGKGGNSLNVEGAGNGTKVAQGVTPEKKGQVITVPIPNWWWLCTNSSTRSKGGRNLSIPTWNYVK